MDIRAGGVPDLEPSKDMENGVGVPSDAVPESGLQHVLLRILWLLGENRRFLVKLVLSCTVAAAGISLLIPNWYESTTRILPPEPQASSMLAAMAARSMPGLALNGGDLLGLKSPGQMFVAVLRSNSVQDNLVRRFALQKEYGAKYVSDARRRLDMRTNITEDRRSGVLTIVVSDNDPGRAQQLAHAYVEELDRVAASLNMSAAHRERLFIEERLRSVKHDLDEASRQLSQFSSQNATIDIKEQGRAMLDAAASLQGQIITAQSELQGLEQTYTANNVRVRTLRSRIAELNRQQARLTGIEASGTVNSSSAGADKNLRPYPSIRQLPLLGVQYAELYRRTKVQETVYELLTQEYELAKIDEAKEIPVVRPLDPADFPQRKSGPYRTLIVLLTALFSGVAGSVWVLARISWSRLGPDDERKTFVLALWGWTGNLIASLRRNQHDSVGGA